MCNFTSDSPRRHNTSQLCMAMDIDGGNIEYLSWNELRIVHELLALLSYVAWSIQRCGVSEMIFV